MFSLTDSSRCGACSQGTFKVIKKIQVFSKISEILFERCQEVKEEVREHTTKEQKREQGPVEVAMCGLVHSRSHRWISVV
jgi:hypothetical protein